MEEQAASNALLNGWKGLVQQALVGSNLRNDGVATLWKAWAPYALTPPEGTDPEERLLHAAALYQQLDAAAAVLPPLQPDALHPAAAVETLPYCSTERLQQLRYVLRYQHDEILKELLLLIQEAACLVHPVLLPRLLHYARRQKHLHPLLAVVAGERGQWLAGHHPDWSYLRRVPLDDATVLEYGKEQERLDYVQGVLAQAPDLAVELMEQVWDTASIGFRAALLQLFAPKAPAAALALLERAHQDSRQTVRRPATPLLAQFEASSLVQRMKERLAELITIEEGALCVVLPDADPALQRDGIQDKRTLVAYQGYRAQLLAQLISSVPPQWWVEHYGRDMERWFEVAQESLWTSIFVAGWAHAAHRFGAPDWLLRCQHWCVQQLQAKALLPVDMEFVYADLSPALFEQFAQTLLRVGDAQILADEHPVIPLLLTPGQAWSEALGWVVLQRIHRTIERESYVFHWNLKAVLKHAAVALPPALYPKIEQQWQSNEGSAWASWHKEIQHLLSLLRFRWEIQQTT